MSEIPLKIKMFRQNHYMNDYAKTPAGLQRKKEVSLEGKKVIKSFIGMLDKSLKSLKLINLKNYTLIIIMNICTNFLAIIY